MSYRYVNGHLLLCCAPSDEGRINFTDALWGKTAAITLPPMGTPKADVLKGTDQLDGIYGLGGNDTIYGFGGGDVLAGAAGNDRIYGGEGADTFFFDGKLNAKTNVDRFMDFNTGEDKIALSRFSFSKLKASRVLKEDAFHVGKKAHDTSDRIIYDKGTGALYYDPDGTGSAKQIKFAVLANKALLTYVDFAIN
jgi:Ca2+-binding RTX toxin-like protein